MEKEWILLVIPAWWLYIYLLCLIEPKEDFDDELPRDIHPNSTKL